MCDNNVDEKIRLHDLRLEVFTQKNYDNDEYNDLVLNTNRVITVSEFHGLMNLIKEYSEMYQHVILSTPGHEMEVSDDE